jgi:anti-sigma B factor antagonist
MGTAEAPGRLLLEYRLDSGVAVVTVTGELDVSTSGLLRDGLLRVLTDENHRGLVVNLARVNFIDSTGIGVLVGIWHRIRAMNSSLALAAPSPRARGILDTTGLTKAFSVYDTRQRPCRHAASRPPASGARYPAVACTTIRWQRLAQPQRDRHGVRAAAPSLLAARLCRCRLFCALGQGFPDCSARCQMGGRGERFPR